jgi:hypothetical protein
MLLLRGQAMQRPTGAMAARLAAELLSARPQSRFGQRRPEFLCSTV